MYLKYLKMKFIVNLENYTIYDVHVHVNLTFKIQIWGNTVKMSISLPENYPPTIIVIFN